jgi:hypothetical protein
VPPRNWHIQAAVVGARHLRLGAAPASHVGGRSEAAVAVTHRMLAFCVRCRRLYRDGKIHIVTIRYTVRPK